MATLTQPGDLRGDEQDDVRHEDARGKAIADKNTAHDQVGAKPLSPDEQGKLDDIESGLKNDGETGVEPSSAAGSTGGSSGGLTSGGGSGRGGLPGRLAKGGLSFMGSHKKGIGISGGIVGLIISLIFGFISLLPLKIESMMKNIVEKRVEVYTNRAIGDRVNKLIETYLGARVAAGAEGDAAADATFERLVVKDSNLAKSLYKSMVVNKYAANLQKDQNIQIRKGSKFGTIDVFQDGEWRNLGSRDARAFLNDSFYQQAEEFGIVKRHFIRSWAKQALGIQSWKFFSGEKGDDADKEVRGQLIDGAAAEEAIQLPKVLSCAEETSTEDCDSSDGRQPPDSSSDSTVNDTVTSADKAAGDAAKKAPLTATSDAVKAIFDSAFAKQITDFFAAAKGPLIAISFIDIASRIDHFFYSGNADKALANYHKSEYAAQFLQWSTITDNIKDPDHKLSGDEVNAVMNQVGDIGGSEGFNHDYLGKDGGQPLTTTNDGKDNTVGRSIDEHSQPIATDYKTILNDIPGGDGWHLALNAWYASYAPQVMDKINGVLGFITGPIISAIEFIFPPLKWMMDFIGQELSTVFLKLVPPAATGLETGKDLMNNLDAGGAVTGQSFMQSIGGVALNPVQSMAVNQEVAATQASQDSKVSFADRLFSVDYGHSMVNTLAAQAPSSPSDAVNQMGGYMASIMSNPLRWFGQVFASLPLPIPLLHTASAASADCGYGLVCYDFTDADLSQDTDTADLDAATQAAAARVGKPVDQITPDDVTAADCPDTGPQKANMCKLDLVAIQTLYAQYTTTDDAGIGDSSGTNTTDSGSGSVSGSAQDLAKQILSNSKITFETAAGKQDIQDTADNKPIAACGLNAEINTSLLKVIVQAAQKYSFSINVLDTGHACDNAFHPKGRAVDFGHVNGVDATPSSLGKSPYHDFAQYIATILPDGGGIGQQPYIGPLNPAPTRYFDDTPNHVHVDVGASAP